MIKQSHKNTAKFLYTGLCVSAFLFGNPSLAAETSIELGASANTSYDDNRFLSTTNKQAVYLFSVSPVVDLIIEDEGSLTVLSTTRTFTKSSDETIEKDRFTYGASLTGNYELQSSNLNLGAGFSRQSIIETEFEDSGAFSNNTTRDRGYAQVGIQADLSERWGVRLSNNFQILDYSVGSFNNYWSNSAGLGLDIAVSETSALTQDAGFLYYKPQNMLRPASNSYSYRAGIRHQLSPDTTISINGGATYFNSSYRWSAVAEITHELENNTFTLRAARELVPSGLGGLRQGETVALEVDFDYSESIAMGIGASWRRSSEINVILIDRREFIEVNPWIAVEVMENLRLRFSYRLRRVRIGIMNNWGISNGFNVGVQY